MQLELTGHFLSLSAACTGWQVVIPQPASHIHNPAGGPAPAPPELRGVERGCGGALFLFYTGGGTFVG